MKISLSQWLWIIWFALGISSLSFAEPNLTNILTCVSSDQKSYTIEIDRPAYTSGDSGRVTLRKYGNLGGTELKNDFSFDREIHAYANGVRHTFAYSSLRGGGFLSLRLVKQSEEACDPESAACQGNYSGSIVNYRGTIEANFTQVDSRGNYKNDIVTAVKPTRVLCKSVDVYTSSLADR